MNANTKWMIRLGAAAGIATLAVGSLAGTANAAGDCNKQDRAAATSENATAERDSNVDEVTLAARAATRADRLKALVAAGTITQTQADALSSRGGMRALIQSGGITRTEARELRDTMRGDGSRVRGPKRGDNQRGAGVADPVGTNGSNAGPVDLG